MFRFDFVLVALILAAAIFITTDRVCQHLEHQLQVGIDLDIRRMGR